jgi:superfamily II helicase
VDSRRRVEELGKALRERGVDAHVTHSSLLAGAKERGKLATSRGGLLALT